MKCDQIGADNPYRNQDAMTQWLANEKVEACKAIYKNPGIEVIFKKTNPSSKRSSTFAVG